ncbi:MAG: GGDEF domain-containing protein [Planctomycetota bacterium]
MSRFDVDRSSSNEGVFSLTQIRHLMRVEFSRAQRYGYPLVSLVLGVDRLDHLRDLYGFEFKETVMNDVVALLKSATRNCDYLGRLMDDRILAILPHTTVEGGTRSVERILAAARSLDFEADGHALRVTLSIGMAHYADENTMFFDSLVEAAEAGHYEASMAGGDRWLLRDPGPGGA